MGPPGRPYWVYPRVARGKDLVVDSEFWGHVFELVTGVMLFVLPIVLTTLGVYAIRYVRKAITDAYSDLTPARQRALRELFGTFVLAAEQLYGKLPGTGEQKKEFVLRLVESWMKDTGFRIPASMIEAFVEAAVYTEINGPSGVKVKEAIVAQAVASNEVMPPVPAVIDSPAARPVANEPVV